MGEVRTISGLDPAAPVPNVVAELEKVLERARSGEVRAVVLGTVHADGNVATGWAWTTGCASAPLIAAASILYHRVRVELLEKQRAK